MGKYISLRPIARFDKSVISYIENNFRTISAAFSSLRATEIGAAETSHTHPIVIENFITPVYINSWSTYAGHHSAAYYKDPYSRVHLRGTITGGTVGLAAFTLPVGYRPLGTLLFAAGEAVQLEVRSNGDVIPTFGASGNGYGLNYSFRSEQ